MQSARIDHHAVLLDETADAGDFCNAFRFDQAEAQVPVLDATQFGEVLLCAAHDVLIDPADPGGVRTKAGCDPGGQPAGRGIEIFQHARARPIEIGAILKDDVNEGDAEEREAADHPRFRHAEHRRGERIGDEVLDNLRRLPGIFRVDDDLHIGEIRNRVKRHARHRVKSGKREKESSQPDQEGVARRSTDDGRNHLAGSG